MSPLSARLNAFHLAALGVWCGALLMTGVAAAVLFPTMRDLDPALPGYAAYPSPHAPIAAGHAAARVFAISDFVQWTAAVFAVGSLFWLLFAERRAGERARPVALIGAALVLTASGLTVYQATVLSPRMDRHMRAYWAAAEAGRIDEATRNKAAFDDDHPRASRAMQQSLAGVSIALVLGCWSAGCGVCRVKPGAGEA